MITVLRRKSNDSKWFYLGSVFSDVTRCSKIIAYDRVGRIESFSLDEVEVNMILTKGIKDDGIKSV